MRWLIFFWLALLCGVSFSASVAAIVSGFLIHFAPHVGGVSAWGHLIGLLGGALGSMGTLVFATQGWDPKWRAGEWLPFAGAIGGVTYWLSRTTPPPMETAILIAALWPVVKAGWRGWSVSALLARLCFFWATGEPKKPTYSRPDDFRVINCPGRWMGVALARPSRRGRGRRK